jgi:hypothetical protein
MIAFQAVVLIAFMVLVSGVSAGMPGSGATTGVEHTHLGKVGSTIQAGFCENGEGCVNTICQSSTFLISFNERAVDVSISSAAHYVMTSSAKPDFSPGMILPPPRL